MWENIWRYLFLTLVRPMIKWVLRRVTGKCELLRIVYSTQEGANRTLKFEKSLKHSKQAALKRLVVDDNVNIDEAVNEIHKIKDIVREVHPKFGPACRDCLCKICGYRQLLAEVEQTRKVPYSSDNQEHEKLLMELWQKLCPDSPLESRISKQWGDVGFQGEDPMTDFRGMGMLGLNNLIFLVRTYTDIARKLLSHSHHPRYGYSFAIVGINITGMAYSLLKKGHLKTHFYNQQHQNLQLEQFHLLYCYLFQDFDQYWRDENPKDIMQFNIVRKKYEQKIIKMLRSDRQTVFIFKP